MKDDGNDAIGSGADNIGIVGDIRGRGCSTGRRGGNADGERDPIDSDLESLGVIRGSNCPTGRNEEYIEDESVRKL